MYHPGQIDLRSLLPPRSTLHSQVMLCYVMLCLETFSAVDDRAKQGCCLNDGLDIGHCTRHQSPLLAKLKYSYIYIYIPFHIYRVE